jgi:hypothetical protein
MSGVESNSPVESAIVFVTPRSMPTCGRFGNRNHAAYNRARQAHIYEADFRNADLCPFGSELADARLAGFVAEAHLAVFGLKARESGSTGKEAGIGSVQIAKRLNERRRMDGCEPGKLGAKLRQLAALRNVVQRNARGLGLSPKVAPLLKSEIIDEAPRVGGRLHQRGLLGGGVKAVAKGSLNHSLFTSRRGAWTQ